MEQARLKKDFVISCYSNGRRLPEECSRAGLAKSVFNKIHSEKVKEYKAAMKEYKQQLNEMQEGDEQPEMPKQKLFFIPVNNSKTGIIELLENSDGRGVFYESELDTLSGAMKMEHGNFSDILRKIYHHEAVSYYRRGGKERIELEKPYLSILMAGTYDQVNAIFSNTSNGLFNRFLFYNLQYEEKFLDVFEKQDNRSIHLARDIIADKFYQAYNFLLSLPEPIVFKLSNEQQSEFNRFFNKQKEAVKNLLSIEDANVTHRWALSTYKIMMTLTAIDEFDDIKGKTELICSERNFTNAFRIFEVLREHFVFVFQMINLSKKQFIKYDEKIRGRVRLLKDERGLTFREIEKLLNIPLATVYRYYNS